MKLPFFLLSLLIILIGSISIFPNDNEKSFVINENNVLGLSWSAPIEEFKKVLKEPNGKCSLSDGNTVYFWGNTLCLEFNKNEVLETVYFAKSLLPFEFKHRIEEKIDIFKIKISDEIYFDMPREDLEKILGKIENSRYPETDVIKKTHKGLQFYISFNSVYKDNKLIQKVGYIKISK